MSFTLEGQHLSQSQGQDVSGSTLFEDISFSWRSPAMHVIMGPSGGGKSSFLKTIGGVWKPRRGRLLINDRPLWGVRTALQDVGLLKDIGFAFQNNALFSSLRVIENLTFPYSQIHPDSTREERDRLAMEWLGKVGLQKSAYQFPFELSGGMQKRLSIARTLILNPAFIFLDDPTAGLDPITSKEMSKLLNQLLEGRDALIVIVTNDPDRARDWGKNLHFLLDRKLLGPGDENYKAAEKRFLV